MHAESMEDRLDLAMDMALIGHTKTHHFEDECPF